MGEYNERAAETQRKHKERRARKVGAVWLRAASKNRYVLLGDMLLLMFAVYMGFALRLTLLIGQGYRMEMLSTAAGFVPVMLIMLWLGKIYQIHWPQASVEEYWRLMKWYSAASALFMVAQRASMVVRIPRSSEALMLLMGLSFLVMWRVSFRLIRADGGLCDTNRPALIVGAGDAGAHLARDLQRRDSGLMPVGFVDDDPEKAGKLIASLPVLGTSAHLADIVKKRKVRTVLLALPSVSGQVVRGMIDSLSALKVDVRVMPPLRELAKGAISISGMRPVSLEDLLRREQIVLDNDGIGRIIRGRTVLVTGAGGSIGSEICRQVMPHEPGALLCLGHGEQSIYNLMESCANAPLKPLIADVADGATMERIFRQYRPHIVFHAAAHKHVPLMEENPAESVRVNCLGTWTVSSLSGKYGAERFVMISTDKAVNPSSVMGATKRVAERVLEEMSKTFRETAYMAVRFGNVLGSRGSVVPKFEAQISKGGPITVTHPDMKRYFMLIPEAVSLVLQAGSMGRGGELYVLDMGEPVNIDQMARTLIRLHGLEPDKDIHIAYSGVRPGEKLFEELFYDPDSVSRTVHDKIFLSTLSSKDRGSMEMLGTICRLMETPRDAIRDTIMRAAAGGRI